MAMNVFGGHSDEALEKIMEALRGYGRKHPHAKADRYRQNAVAVRVRVIDSDFAGLNRSQRSQRAWEFLGTLPDEVHSDICLLLLTPNETERSFGNVEFEDPAPSML